MGYIVYEHSYNERKPAATTSLLLLVINNNYILVSFRPNNFPLPIMLAFLIIRI